MDTTPNYVKMCEKAEEIQSLKKIKAITAYRLVCGEIIDEDGNYIIEVEKPIPDIQGYYYVWLPRQDQLQAMMGEELYQLLGGFDRWLLKMLYEKDSDLYSSMEQLWLTFVMHQKFGKTWNSKKEEWVV